MGNICRSPAAEGIAKSIIKKKDLAGLIEIDSAGTIDYHEGEPPDPRMIAHASKRGYNLNSLARQFNPQKDFEHFDYIITMDDENYKHIISLDDQKKHKHKVFKITSFAKDKNISEVPDPYYRGSKGFELVLDILENSVNGLINRIEDDIRRENKEIS
ncbi:MAG: low molecular weight phosphotyrosine protein phosphatase [Ignavibacteria bacterium]|nr:low molecular weight phosphotyrosine protein phosphatase [Ignavibacteria bacterium]MBT8383452.1 low molecular weight phosphotyrosine protein phosphatase [Ignavibacteria bacterium]MBT8390727.1 low molecular weight phosphotyrosine protein phosphatase [Ignavibacteria bacterium]NNJ52674.1 low molecular weight phosphotyrosine protein phosphatase [Ignavibacteriaceae bacterium]NNL22530.1 low molecular weight phosphotyrosine protein phosphatase [Ignavibacteriaceae bacterium]